ncbi:MAG: flagellar assembly peptidoglycan hydrolase FlgJ [Rhodoferax sp.]|nr:flagellar assembly peptidoglycan hydrolase FlgJ [Rhodoferax sp.]HQX58735.1 flagellar assembly peptidoglycan hydrolase FlgJ [Burkholderiaceae bacterium]
MALSNLSVNSNALAADGRSLDALKLQAGKDGAGAIKEAARQFEALFMRELIKSMREATMKSGMLDSAGGDLSADLLDQQLAVQMTGMPGGLSEQIARQLSQRINGNDGAAAVPATPTASLSYGATPTVRTTASQADFVQRHTQAAQRVEQASGIPSAFMLGQAGHETGWGRSEITMADGTPSFNLFGIKATGGWTGKVAEITTTEYVNGAAQKVVAKFRAYDSYEDSMRDYARMITQSPRYAQASQQTASAHAYATGLQKAGYATDPEYASKLSRAINSTLQLQRAQSI